LELIVNQFLPNRIFIEKSCFYMRKTKIVCTIGPATDDDKVLREMMLAGMNVARFNFSHGDYEMHQKRFEQVVRLRKELGLPIATMLDTTEQEVKTAIKELEDDGLLRGYKAVVDWEKLDGAFVSAIVELNVVPKAGLGFEEVARKIMSYPQVESVFLMSGVYDLNVVVKGKTLRDIAWFVAKELATIDSVTSTTTHFVMRRYKEMDVDLVSTDEDDRGQLWI